MSNYSSNKFQLEAKNTSWSKIYSYIKPSSNILDIGCSSGTFGKELKSRKHCVVYGTEVDRGDYQAANKVLDRAFLFNIETDPIPKEVLAKKYDAIIFADVLEHLVNPVTTLKRIKPLLAINGKVIFSIPNMAHMSVRLQLLSGRFNYNETGLLDKTHLHFYDYNEVQRIFAASGLQITEIDYNTLTYPKNFLQKKLTELKLADNGFIEQSLKDRQAQAFQYVGFASLPAKGKKITSVPLKTTTPEKELTIYIDSLQDQVAKMKSELQQNQLELDKAITELKTIRASFSWKVGRVLTHPVKTTRKITKRQNYKNDARR